MSHPTTLESRPSSTLGSNPTREIVRSFDSRLIRAYAQVRFIILRQIFLDEIGQYLPKDGRVLDLGCGFGLFSLYFAALEPRRRLVGVDLNEKRIELARKSAERLGLGNVEYHVGNGVDWDTDETFDAIYLLDLIHHMPRESIPSVLAKLKKRLNDGGILILKDIEDRPAWKRWFTLLLDRLMVGMEPIHYWPPAELIPLLEDLGFEVAKHRMLDFLPYPHIVYVNRLRS